MRFPRLPAWFVYPAALLILLLAALDRRDRYDAPPPPPPLPSGEGAVLAETAPIDPAVVMPVRRHRGPNIGAAVSVGDSGLWLTARSALRDCARPAIMVSGLEGVTAKAEVAPASRTAVLTTSSGAPALPLTSGPLRGGQLAYVVAFPRGRPGEVAMRLLGPQTRSAPWRRSPAAPVLAWAEIGRTEGLAGELGGLAGAPALDSEGRIVGVALGEAPRRGRIYTTAPKDVLRALASAGAKPSPQAAGLPITPENYGLAADDLRRALRVAPVACIQR